MRRQILLRCSKIISNYEWIIHYSVEANEHTGKWVHSICLPDVLLKFLMCNVHTSILLISAGDGGKWRFLVHSDASHGWNSQCRQTFTIQFPPTCRWLPWRCFSPSQTCILKKLVEVPLASLGQDTLHSCFLHQIPALLLPWVIPDLSLHTEV